MTELRAADLRFTSNEAAEFLNKAMGLSLSQEDIATLEHRTEGWIAGLQLAALAMQGTFSAGGQQDTQQFYSVVYRQPSLCAGLSYGRSPQSPASPHSGFSPKDFDSGADVWAAVRCNFTG